MEPTHPDDLLQLKATQTELTGLLNPLHEDVLHPIQFPPALTLLAANANRVNQPAR